MKYRDYEISAVKEEDGCTVPCPDNDPERIDFGLYGIAEDGRRLWVSDHPTRTAAESEMKNLLHSGCP